MPLGKGLHSLLPHTSSGQTTRQQADGHNDESDRIWHIPISEITPNPEQPRQNFSHQELEDLVQSIKERGVLQPLSVTEKIDGGYELISGERRLRAAQIGGLATVPCLVRSATQQDKLELALIENIQRQDLNPIEEAFAYKRLVEEFGLKHNEVARQVGKSRPVISNTIRLLDLPELIQKALIDGELSAGKARALLSLKDQGEQVRLFRKMVGEGITVRDMERVVASQGPASRKGSIRMDPNLLAQEQLLEERLGTKVEIHKKGKRGTIRIHYSSPEELKRLIEELK